METGESGASGAHVVRRVKKENNHEPANVILQRLSMVEKTVEGTPARQSLVTRMSLAQVRT